MAIACDIVHLLNARAAIFKFFPFFGFHRLLVGQFLMQRVNLRVISAAIMRIGRSAI